MSEAGAPKSLLNIGEEAKPPFAVLPNPSVLFLGRSKRLAALAVGHELQPYLEFLARLAQVQHDIQIDLPGVSLPPFERIGQGLEHGIPPLSRPMFEPDEAVGVTLARLLDRLAGVAMPAATIAVVEAAGALSSDNRAALLAAALRDADAQEHIAQRGLVMAGLQVHFARLATLLIGDDLKPIADGVCPACGSPPVSSTVVGWPKAHNTRFCTCSLCATMWNVVRVKCLMCSSTEGIAFRAVEGKADTVKAETCDKCRSYVKTLYQVNDPVLEAVADNVGTLGLDMLLAEEGWKRGAHNPFLLGY